MSFNKKVVLESVDLMVARGEIFGITGLNGSGKTVLLKILATILRPDKGKVEISGYDIAKDTNHVRSLIGYMPDHSGYNGRLNVGEYLGFFYSMYSGKRKDYNVPVDKLLNVLDMHEFKEMLLSDLSRGQKQKTSLARAIIHDPSVLLLDDPELGMDRECREKMISLLKGQRSRGRTIMVASRSIDLLNSIAHRIGVLHEGRLMWIFPAGVEDQESIRHRIAGLK